MANYIWKIVKSIIGALLAILRPFRRLICRRQKITDELELVSVGPGHVDIQYTNTLDKSEPLSWDQWEEQVYLSGMKEQLLTNGLKSEPGPKSHSQPPGYPYPRKISESEPEPDINFFEDMTPDVKKQPKILVRKKNTMDTAISSTLANRFTAVSDVPLVNSELEAWQDESNAWDTEEMSEDLTWQAQEAIREKKRLERMERQVEQQKKKLRKEETRGAKGGSLIATKLS